MSKDSTQYQRFIDAHKQSKANGTPQENILFLLSGEAMHFQQYKLFNNLHWRDLFNDEKSMRWILPGSASENASFLRHAGLTDQDVPEFLELYKKRFNDWNHSYMNLCIELDPNVKNIPFEDVFKISPSVEQSRAQYRIPLYHRFFQTYYPHYEDQALTHAIDSRIEHFEKWKKRNPDFFFTETGPDGEGVMLGSYWTDPKYTPQLVKWNLYTNDVYGMALLAIQNRISITDFIQSVRAMKWDTLTRENHRRYDKCSVKDDMLEIFPNLLQIKQSEELQQELQDFAKKHPNVVNELISLRNKPTHEGGFMQWIEWISLMVNNGIIASTRKDITDEIRQQLVQIRNRVGSVELRENNYVSYNLNIPIIELLKQEQPWKEVGFWVLLGFLAWGNKPEDSIEKIPPELLSHLKDINISELLLPKVDKMKSEEKASQWSKHSTALFNVLTYLVPYLNPSDRALIGAYATVYAPNNPRTLRSYWKAQEQDPLFAKSVPSTISAENSLLFALTRQEPTELNVLSDAVTLKRADQFDLAYQWLLKNLAPEKVVQPLDFVDEGLELA